MYHYTECGLDNVWLANGYRTRGDAVSIENSAGLHDTIGREIANKPSLSGAELRYLRKALGFPQVELARVLQVSEEAVSLWERKDRVPYAAGCLVQALYLEITEGGAKLRELVETLAQRESNNAEHLVFNETPDTGWRGSPKQAVAA